MISGRGILVIAGLLLLGACQRAAEPPAAAAGSAPVSAEPAGPLQEFSDYRLTETNQGVRQWVLDSKRMLKYADREEVELVDVHMDFFSAGAHQAVMEADSGRVDPRTRAVHAWGAVDITTDDGRRLQTEVLFFDNVTGRITNDVFNRFTHGVDVLTGVGLDATPDLQYVEIRREVAAEVADPAPGPGERP